MSDKNSPEMEAALNAVEEHSPIPANDETVYKGQAMIDKAKLPRFIINIDDDRLNKHPKMREFLNEMQNEMSDQNLIKTSLLTVIGMIYLEEDGK